MNNSNSILKVACLETTSTSSLHDDAKYRKEETMIVIVIVLHDSPSS